jgi:lipoate-protein ligase A
MEAMTAMPSPATDSAARRHGEYKVPGGKLVVVDLDVADGRLSNVSVSGDFFLEPDEALPDINGGLTGLPESTTAAELAAVVTASLPSNAALFGFSPTPSPSQSAAPWPRPRPGRTTTGP